MAKKFFLQQIGCILINNGNKNGGAKIFILFACHDVIFSKQSKHVKSDGTKWQHLIYNNIKPVSYVKLRTVLNT